MAQAQINTCYCHLTKFTFAPPCIRPKLSIILHLPVNLWQFRKFYIHVDWISILLKISKINANFDIIAACFSSPSLLLLSFASCSLRNLALSHSIIIEISRKIAFGTTWVWRGLGSMNKGPNATIRLVRRQNHAGTTVSWTTVQREKSSHAYKLSSNVQTACSTDSLNNCPKHSILRFSSFALKIYL